MLGKAGEGARQADTVGRATLRRANGFAPLCSAPSQRMVESALGHGHLLFSGVRGVLRRVPVPGLLQRSLNHENHEEPGSTGRQRGRPHSVPGLLHDRLELVHPRLHAALLCPGGRRCGDHPTPAPEKRRAAGCSLREYPSWRVVARWWIFALAFGAVSTYTYTLALGDGENIGERL